MARSYSELYQDIARAGGDAQARQRAIEALLGFVRAELETPRIARDRIKADLEILQGHGTAEDIRRIDDIIARPSMDDCTLDFACEVKRQIQERCYLLAEISQEEEDAVRGGALVPKDPRSQWLAVRRGVIVAEAAERADVEAEITRKQRVRSSYVAVVVPADGVLRNSHERR
jgi:tryptophan 2,3-dioxygenase